MFSTGKDCGAPEDAGDGVSDMPTPALACYRRTPPPSPLPEAERGRSLLLPLSASGRGLGEGFAKAAMLTLPGTPRLRPKTLLPHPRVRRIRPRPHLPRIRGWK